MSPIWPGGCAPRDTRLFDVDSRPRTCPLAVIHQDDQVIVVDKPAGLVPGKLEGRKDCLEIRCRIRWALLRDQDNDPDHRALFAND